MPYITPCSSRTPAKLAKFVAKQIKAKDVRTDDGKGKHPYAGTDGKRDWCPRELSVEVSLRDESNRVAHCNGTHCEKVGVCNQVANQRWEAAQRCWSPEQLLGRWVVIKSFELTGNSHGEELQGWMEDQEGSRGSLWGTNVGSRLRCSCSGLELCQGTWVRVNLTNFLAEK